MNKQEKIKMFSLNLEAQEKILKELEAKYPKGCADVTIAKSLVNQTKEMLKKAIEE